MKARLTFTLPEEESEFRLALDGGRYKRVVQELDEFLRVQLKYSDMPECEREAHEKLRNKLYKLLEQHGLDLLG